MERTRGVVLLVDEVAVDRELAWEILVKLGFDVRQARDSGEALEAIASEEPDLVLLATETPGGDGPTLAERLEADERQRHIPVAAVRKPIDGERLVLAFARAVEARDRFTEHHAERVGRYAREIARAYGLPEDELDVLYRGGLLHDLGKLAVPAEILRKQGALSDDERAIVRTHSAEGERICRRLRTLARFLPIIRHHHERIDGSGYPDHLVGTQIPLHARIAAVADVWDALVSDRPHRAGLERELALRTISSGAGKIFDARCANVFLELVDRGVIGRVAAEAPLDVAHSSSGG